MIVCLALLKMHLYISVNHVHSWYYRKLSLLVRRGVDFKNFWCVQHNWIFRLFFMLAPSPPPPPSPECLQIKRHACCFWASRMLDGSPAGRSFRVESSSRWLTGWREQRRAADSLKSQNTSCYKVNISFLQGEHFVTLDPPWIDRVRLKPFNMDRLSVCKPTAVQRHAKIYIQEVSLNHRTPLTSHSVLCELCVGGSEAAWIGTGVEADCSKVWTQSASHTSTRLNTPTSFNRPLDLRNFRAI